MTARARTSDPDTSHEAAASVTDIATTRDRILWCLLLEGPMADHELCGEFNRLRWPHSDSGIRTRLHELEQVGMVARYQIDTTTRSGRRAATWYITDTGRRHLWGASA